MIFFARKCLFCLYTFIQLLLQTQDITPYIMVLEENTVKKIKVSWRFVVGFQRQIIHGVLKKICCGLQHSRNVTALTHIIDCIQMKTSLQLKCAY